MSQNFSTRCGCGAAADLLHYRQERTSNSGAYVHNVDGEIGQCRKRLALITTVECALIVLNAARPQASSFLHCPIARSVLCVLLFKSLADRYKRQ